MEVRANLYRNHTCEPRFQLRQLRFWSVEHIRGIQSKPRCNHALQSTPLVDQMYHLQRAKKVTLYILLHTLNILDCHKNVFEISKTISLKYSDAVICWQSSRPISKVGLTSKLLDHPLLIKVIQNYRPEMTIRGFCWWPANWSEVESSHRMAISLHNRWYTSAFSSSH